MINNAGNANIIYRNTKHHNSWFKESNLKAGRVYLFEGGKLALYLGKSVSEHLIFYAVASAYLIYIDNKGTLTFGNYNIQIESLIYTINKAMSNPCAKDSILKYMGIPRIYGEFPFVNFEQKYKRWYTISFSGMFSDKVNKTELGVPELIT